MKRFKCAIAWFSQLDEEGIPYTGPNALDDSAMIAAIEKAETGKVAIVEAETEHAAVREFFAQCFKENWTAIDSNSWIVEIK